MKISPVIGAPTIPQPSSSGRSSEALDRIRAIATGKPLPEPIEEDKAKKLANQLQTITMNTNKTVLRDGLPPESSSESQIIPTDELAKPDSGISDTTVQANEVSEATQPISPQLAALARERRALQVEKKALVDREKSIADEARAQIISQLKVKPLGLMQEHGVTYDQLTQELLGNQINPEVEALKAEIKALKEGVDEKFSASETKHNEQNVHYVANKLDALLDQNDEFELLKEADGKVEIVSRIIDHYEKTGVERNVADVAKEYQEELYAELARYAKLKQVQGRLMPTEPLQPQPQTQQGMRTLTNKDTARPQMDRKQRAILAMQGQLKR